MSPALLGWEQWFWAARSLCGSSLSVFSRLVLAVRPQFYPDELTVSVRRFSCCGSALSILGKVPLASTPPHCASLGARFRCGRSAASGPRVRLLQLPARQQVLSAGEHQHGKHDADSCSIQALPRCLHLCRRQLRPHSRDTVCTGQPAVGFDPEYELSPAHWQPPACLLARSLRQHGLCPRSLRFLQLCVTFPLSEAWRLPVRHVEGQLVQPSVFVGADHFWSILFFVQFLSTTSLCGRC
jgi:hypothetical protein